MDKNSRIYVAGHRGLVGSAIIRKLRGEGFGNLIMRSHGELDLMRQSDVEVFFKKEKPEYVFLAAAMVGGILANNTYPAEFIYNNLMIQANVIHAAYLAGVKRLLFLGSSCIYPRDCPQPMKEEFLLSGELEKTNEPYAVAKIAGIKMCQSYNRQYGTKYISVMPTNLYGPGDNFDLERSHVLPALIRKFHEAKGMQEGKGVVSGSKHTVTVWGSGSPRREFLHVDDLADACLFIIRRFEEDEMINIGVGKDITIEELAIMIKEVIGFKGDIRFDPSKPDGTPRKLLDVTRLETLGWRSKISLREGIKDTHRWYMDHVRRAVEKAN